MGIRSTSTTAAPACPPCTRQYYCGVPSGSNLGNGKNREGFGAVSHSSYMPHTRYHGSEVTMPWSKQHEGIRRYAGLPIIDYFHINGAAHSCKNLWGHTRRYIYFRNYFICDEVVCHSGGRGGGRGAGGLSPRVHTPSQRRKQGLPGWIHTYLPVITHHVMPP